MLKRSDVVRMEEERYLERLADDVKRIGWKLDATETIHFVQLVAEYLELPCPDLTIPEPKGGDDEHS